MLPASVSLPFTFLILMETGGLRVWANENNGYIISDAQHPYFYKGFEYTSEHVD
jgi:hypothetical protein